MNKKFCLSCKKEILPGPYHKEKKFCDKNCRREHERKLYQKSRRKRKIPLATSTVGAIGELMVATYLLDKGYSVFRSLSPSCECDLICMKNGKLLRVEVTTGSRNINGSLTYPEHKKELYDIIAVVLPKSNDIVFVPEL